MIYAFNFTCNRDLDLSMLMGTTLKKHYHNVFLSVTNTDVDPEYKGYGNGSGWPQSMLKLKRMRQVVNAYDPKPTDFILSVDSDVVFTSPEVFTYVKPQYGLIGIRHSQPYNTMLGPWGHMSGALIFIRGDIAKQMVNITEPRLNDIRYQHFKTHDMTENEDVVLSYLASYVGANYFDLGSVPNLSSGNFENDVERRQFASFYHLNYCPTEFLGEGVDGKWDIPKVLKKKGIEL